MKRLNIGVLAHVDAGKTTLVERILFLNGVIRQMGKIETGNTMMDSLPLERDRGVTIKNSYTTVMNEGVQINLIDTPGHYDFVDEVEHVLEVLDAVVLVVSGIDGVQSQTKKFWRLLQVYKLPIILFVNKSDYPLYDASKMFTHLTNLMSSSLVSLKSQSKGFQLQDDDLYTLVEGHDDLEEKLLENRLTQEDISTGFLKQFNRSQLYPVISGSAKEGLGIETLLEVVRGVEPKKEEAILSGFVYKVAYDKKLGKGCYIRLFGGQLTARQVVSFNRPEASPHKVKQLTQIIGGKVKDVSLGRAGDILIVYGLADGIVGDTFGDYTPLGIRKTPALFLLSLTEETGKVRELRQAAFELSEEYPSLTYEWFESSEEIQVTIMGEMQAEIICYELQERYGLMVRSGEPKIIYHETPFQSAYGFEAYTMPKPSWAIVELLIEPGPRNGGYQFINQANNDVLLPRYHSQIERSLIETLKVGRMGWQVVDLTVTLLSGESHREHTHPLDFALATPMALQDGLDKAEMILLEPTILMKVSTTNKHLSKVIAEIIMMEGKILQEEYLEQDGYLEAVVPMATSLGYGALFFKQTKGEGVLEQAFYNYQECPKDRYQSRQRQGVDPLDREKWILHRRGAIS